ncbi:hypothetical protein [Natrinema amylolyticum]|uniref:hypothetical protein n=1 Tax=Natrinema amylolyticum TaxID=2878679 RepID=UPI001CFADB7E|nr:hypothetical protein [Natrinema amylolyticum]
MSSFNLDDVDRGILHLLQEDVLDFLYQRGEYSDAPSPQIILLNPHLPEMDGYDLLEDLKNEPAFRAAPVLVLSESDGEEEVWIRFYSTILCIDTDRNPIEEALPLLGVHLVYAHPQMSVGN